MISNLKCFPRFWCLVAQRHLNVWRSSVHYVSDDFLCNRFCTMTETININQQPKVTESPELPDWVRIVKKEEAAVELEDDFLLPSFSEWVKNEKLRAREVDVRSLASDLTESDVDKISKVLRFPCKSPDAVVDALNQSRFVVSECLVEQILKRFSFEWIPSYGFFKWAKVQKGVTLSPDLYNLMVDNLGKSKKFGLMRELLDEMSHLQGYVSLNTMGKVMRRFAKSGKYEDAIGEFERMGEFGLRKDTSAMNLLIDAMVKGGSVEHAHKVYLNLKNHIAPSVETYNILVHGWCKGARKIDEANKTVKDMEEHGFSPDVVTYTNFIDAYCREKDFRKVDAIFKEMQMKGCSPNVVTYTTTMKALGKAKELNKALDVYEKMKQNGCVPDNSFYSSLILMLGTSGRLKDCYDVFEDMPNQGVSPDTTTYNTMITIAARNSKEEDALKFLQKMEESRCKPDICTYAPLFKMCCRMRRLKVLSLLLNHMFKNDVSMDLGTYDLLVRGLCRNRNAKRACAVFELAVLRGLLPMDTMYDNLVKELEKEGLKQEKKHVEELMSQAKQQTMYDNLVKELQREGLKQEKKHVEELMSQAKQQASNIEE